MRERSILIVGAGMGGLAAGIHGQASGYRTSIYEAHSVPGGQAATWMRKGYSFDGCLHHLFGCRTGSRLNDLWHELGAMPRSLAPTRECVAVQGADGRLFVDYYDPERLREHLHALAPGDRRASDAYVRATELCARHDLFGEMLLGRKRRIAGMLPTLIALRPWLTLSMGQMGASSRTRSCATASRLRCTPCRRTRRFCTSSCTRTG